MTAKKQLSKTELENLLKHLQADFDNYRKRIEQEKIQIIQSANANLLLDIMPVVDNFRRGLAHRSLGEGGAEDPWTQGIKAIEKQLEDTLEKHGLQVIEVKIGEQFNPALQEAIAHQPTPDHKPNSIVKIVENGYQLSGKVLRPAKVVVA
ncbi:nucleotide exchange factor GrpE [Candidatus Berkelbacteria bacterium]|nr:nucleotide exchange factor GrpE [Candidatus Berkelbacteria bacterium]